MATVMHAISAHDVVVLREPVGTWPAGTTGAVISAPTAAPGSSRSPTPAARHWTPSRSPPTTRRRAQLARAGQTVTAERHDGAA